MTIDLAEICRDYKGLWVGFKNDGKTVIAKGKTVEEVMQKAAKKKFLKPILFRVPAKILPYVGGF